MDRGELTPSTDPIGLRAKCHLTATHRQIQKDIQDHSAQHTVHGWVPERAEKKVPKAEVCPHSFYCTNPSLSPDLVFRQSRAGLGGWGWAAGREPRVWLRLPPGQR